MSKKFVNIKNYQTKLALNMCGAQSRTYISEKLSRCYDLDQSVIEQTVRFISSLMSSEGSHYIITFARSETRTICGPKRAKNTWSLSHSIIIFGRLQKLLPKQLSQYRGPDEFTFGPQHVAQNDHMLWYIIAAGDSNT